MNRMQKEGYKKFKFHIDETTRIVSSWKTKNKELIEDLGITPCEDPGLLPREAGHYYIRLPNQFKYSTALYNCYIYVRGKWFISEKVYLPIEYIEVPCLTSKQRETLKELNKNGMRWWLSGHYQQVLYNIEMIESCNEVTRESKLYWIKFKKRNKDE